MELTIFRSGKGDCLLLSAGSGSATKRVLIDAGMPDAFKAHIAGPLSNVPRIDVAYVSHIDQDHIGGMLALIDNMFAWRVYDFKTKGGKSWKKPAVPRPPEIKQFWHNAFEDQVGGAGVMAGVGGGGGLETAMSISAMLRRFPASIGDTDGHRQHDPIEAAQDLATSIAEAIRLSHRLAADQLGIPVNSKSGGKLLLAKANPLVINLAPMKFTILGPTEDAMEDLRKEWNAWLLDNKKRARDLRDAAVRDAGNLGLSDVELARLGNRAKVTAPNLASLMFLVQEGGKTLLLTGDGHWKDILDGLRLVPGFKKGPIHVDVLKVQHHGSEHNWHEDFSAQVTADQYVFCGNGEHENPDLEVVEVIASSRLGTGAAPAAGPNTPFTFWFSGNSQHADEKSAARDHMRKVETLVAKLATGAGGRLKSRFMPASSSSMLLKV